MSAAPTFRPPLILESGARGRLRRSVDLLLTLALWAGWGYLLAGAVGALWIPPFVHRLLPVTPPDHPWEVIRVGLYCLAGAGVICAAMLTRTLIDRRRFGGADRRRHPAMLDDAALAAAFRVRPEELPAWRRSRRLVVHYDEDGTIGRIEAGD